MSDTAQLFGARCLAIAIGFALVHVTLTFPDVWHPIIALGVYGVCDTLYYQFVAN